MSQPRLRVAIVGCGIGGLMFAIALEKFRKDISADIYESQDHLAELGAGISMSGRIWHLIQSLGLRDDLMAISSTEGTNIPFRKGDQEVGIDIHNPTLLYNLRTFHRRDFLKVLSGHLPSDYKIHFSKRLASYAYAESGQVTLHFHDDSIATADLVVGCDGIRSAVRSTLYRRMAEEAEKVGDTEAAVKASSHIIPTYSGTSAYRGLIPTENLLKRYPGHPGATEAVIRFGKNKHLVVFPISAGRLINVVLFVSTPETEGQIYEGPWMVPSTKLDLPQVVRLWEEETKALVECMDEASLWAINVVADLPTYVGDRVAILGDAAHAMVPHHGSGAGQAFEDGYLLAGLLANPAITSANLSLALQIYDKFRRPFSQNVQRQSRRTGLMFDLNAAGCEAITEEESAAGAYSMEQLNEIAHEISDSMSWIGSGSIVEDTMEAVRMLESELARLHTSTVANQ